MQKGLCWDLFFFNAIILNQKKLNPDMNFFALNYSHLNYYNDNSRYKVKNLKYTLNTKEKV